ncbi:hypothetical protein ACFQ0B_65905 [Nonomuraea thailandensis]
MDWPVGAGVVPVPGAGVLPSSRVTSASAACLVKPAMLTLSPSIGWVTMGAARTVLGWSACEGASTIATGSCAGASSSMSRTSFSLNAGATAMRTEYRPSSSRSGSIRCTAPTVTPSSSR